MAATTTSPSDLARTVSFALLGARLSLGCDAAGIACTGDLDGLCARGGMHCVPSWNEAADAATWCHAHDVSNARAAVTACLGNRVVVATVGGATAWYFYDSDGGLVGATRRNAEFQQECLAGRPSFQMPLDCAASDNPHCCRFDFGKEMACVGPAQDAGTD